MKTNNSVSRFLKTLHLIDKKIKFNIEENLKTWFAAFQEGVLNDYYLFNSFIND